MLLNGWIEKVAWTEWKVEDEYLDMTQLIRAARIPGLLSDLSEGASNMESITGSMIGHDIPSEHPDDNIIT